MLSKEKALKIKKTAEKYKDVPAPYGEDINLEEYKIEKGGISVDSLMELDEEYKSKLESIGIDIEEKSSAGSYLQINNKAVYSKTDSKIEMMPISEALKKYDLDDYYWNLVEIKDKYSARAAL